MSKITKPGLKDLNYKLRSITANDFMTHYVMTTTEDTPLADVAELMIKARISGLPVINKKGKLSGMITATDLFIMMDMIKSGDIIEEGDMSVFNPTVKYAMSTEITKIKRSTTLEEIISIMKYKNIHTIPVYEGSKMVGIVGRRDIFRNFYSIVHDLFYR